jgi:hypothetical protein
MQTKIAENGTEIVSFENLDSFYKYICEIPFNEAFRWAKHSSVSGEYDFTKTNSFEEASELFKNGWEDMAKQLTQKLKVEESKSQPIMKPRSKLDVCGYQAIVPLYLQGVPCSMMNKKLTPVKQKVITINKSINYRGSVSTEEIVNQSVKAMQIVKKLEAQQYRVNLNIILGTECEDKKFVVKIRIKSANEKMNVSKLAFPLVHPSMLRRLLFRFIEVYPNITKDFVFGYGAPIESYELKKCMNDGEYLIPAFLTKNINSINNLEDISEYKAK